MTELTKAAEKDDRILLRAPDGGQGWFTFIDMISHGGRDYAALADEHEDLCIMELLEGGPGQPERYREIESDALFDTVLSLFAAQSPDLFE